MPRAIWTGAISFGLVHVPVRMYSAIDEQDLEFHYVHAKDGSRIGYEKICKLEDKPVPEEEIVKAFEVEKGEYVYLGDEDFDAAEVEGSKTIDISDFVPYDEIDPIFFERTYYLGPQEGAEKVYALLRRAMEDSRLAAVAKYVMRERQHLGALRVRDGVIVLEKMYFADEIRPSDELAPRDANVDERELDMAMQLIDRFAGSFKPAQYEDTYRKALLEIIDRKRKGEEIHAEPARELEQPPDLIEALRASLEAAQARRGDGRTKPEPKRRRPRKQTARR
ncbi:MAG: Ku protein [Actinomycetota bacterium]|nr:Ku protein [Actinomycetota bacterium]